MSETSQFPVTPTRPGSHNRPRRGRVGRPENGIGGLARAVMAHLKGDAGAALSSLEPDAPGVAETPETVAARAHLLSELKRHEEAAAEYDKLLALRPAQRRGALPVRRVPVSSGPVTPTRCRASARARSWTRRARTRIW